jgi:hypothetical protein
MPKDIDAVYPCEHCQLPIEEGEQVVGFGSFRGKLINLAGGTVEWSHEMSVDVYHVDCAEKLGYI